MQRYAIRYVMHYIQASVRTTRPQPPPPIVIPREAYNYSRKVDRRERSHVPSSDSNPHTTTISTSLSCSTLSRAGDKVDGHNGDGLALRRPVLAVEVVEVAGAAAVPGLLVAEGEHAALADGKAGGVDGAGLGGRVELELVVRGLVTELRQYTRFEGEWGWRGTYDVASAALVVLQHAILQRHLERAVRHAGRHAGAHAGAGGSGWLRVGLGSNSGSGGLRLAIFVAVSYEIEDMQSVVLFDVPEICEAGVAVGAWI